MVLNEARAGLGLALLTTALAMATPTNAADDDVDKRRQEAKTLADSGFDLFNKGLYAEAADLFRRADERFHSPVFVVFIADAEQRQGHLLRARERYRAVAQERLAPDASEAFRKAQDDAAAALEDLGRRIPTVTLRVPAGTETITLDATTLDPARIDQPIAIDPGMHRVRVTGPAGATGERGFSAEAGEAVTLELAFGDASSSVTDGGGGRSWVGPGIAFGVGGAGLLMGAVSGALFIGRAGDLKARCPDNQCEPKDKAEGDAVATLGNVSTAGWVIGGVGVATGVVLLLVSGGGDAEAAEQARSGPRLDVGPGGVSLTGRF